MDLYEYQGKELFKRFGIPVSDGRLAETPEQARAAAEDGMVTRQSRLPTRVMRPLRQDVWFV